MIQYYDSGKIRSNKTKVTKLPLCLTNPHIIDEPLEQTAQCVTLLLQLSDTHHEQQSCLVAG